MAGRSQYRGPDGQLVDVHDAPQKPDRGSKGGGGKKAPAKNAGTPGTGETPQEGGSK